MVWGLGVQGLGRLGVFFGCSGVWGKFLVSLGFGRRVRVDKGVGLFLVVGFRRLPF